jgi:DNA-binding NarL/FixJ family response regulator
LNTDNTSSDAADPNSAAAPSMRVLVADHEPTRLGVRLALEGFAEICAETGDRADTVEAALRERPDVCLIGRSLAGGGIEAVREISVAGFRTAIVVLADSEDVDDLLKALRAGAIGYMPIGFEPGQLRRAMAAVRTDQAAIPRAMVRDLVDEIRSLERSAQSSLSLRETQVLTMLRRGDSTAGIAVSLDISAVTVRRHISSLVRKAGVRDRAELVSAFSETDVRANV